MDSIRALFALNREVFQFLYGLVFFVLGLAIAVQSRSYSRLELARSLSWLAAFGLIHSVYEWSELFARVQEAYLSPQGIFALHAFHLMLLCLSFIALFEFGVALLRPLGRGQWLHNVSVALLGVYLVVILWPLPRWLPWNYLAALVRDGIAFPGGLLAAYGLVDSSWEAASLHGGRITPDVADYAYAFGNVGFANAWIALASFALCSGWVILSTRVLERWMGWWVVVAGLGLVVARFVWTTGFWGVGYTLFWLWVLVVCIRLIRRPDRWSNAAR